MRRGGSLTFQADQANIHPGNRGKVRAGSVSDQLTHRMPKTQGESGEHGRGWSIIAGHARSAGGEGALEGSERHGPVTRGIPYTPPLTLII